MALANPTRSSSVSNRRLSAASLFRAESSTNRIRRVFTGRASVPSNETSAVCTDSLLARATDVASFLFRIHGKDQHIAYWRSIDHGSQPIRLRLYFPQPSTSSDWDRYVNYINMPLRHTISGRVIQTTSTSCTYTSTPTNLPTAQWTKTRTREFQAESSS